MPKKSHAGPYLNPQAAKTVDEHIERLADWRGEIVQHLRELILATLPKVQENFLWGQPVYELNGPLCFIKVFRNQINFGFWRGDQLPDPKRLLAMSNEKIRYIKLTAVEEIQQSSFRNLLKVAAKLNREFGDPTKHW